MSTLVLKIYYELWVACHISLSLCTLISQIMRYKLILWTEIYFKHSNYLLLKGYLLVKTYSLQTSTKIELSLHSHLDRGRTEAYNRNSVNICGQRFTRVNWWSLTNFASVSRCVAWGAWLQLNWSRTWTVNTLKAWSILMFLLCSAFPSGNVLGFGTRHYRIEHHVNAG